jgi:hypothetical protein
MVEKHNAGYATERKAILETSDTTMKAIKEGIAQDQKKTDNQIANVTKWMNAEGRTSAEVAEAQTYLTVLYKKQSEERSKAAETAANKSAAAEKKSTEETVRGINNAVVEAEKLYAQGQISEQQLVETYNWAAQEYTRLSLTKGDADGKFFAQREANLAKAEKTTQQMYDREHNLAKEKLSWEEDSLAKEMALLDLEKGYKAQKLDEALEKHKAYLRSIGWDEESISAEVTALWDTFYAWQGRKKEEATAKYKAGTQEALDYEIKKIEEAMRTGKKSQSEGLADILDLHTKHYEERDKLVDASLKYEQALLKNDLIPGWQVALDEILLKQKTWGQLSYEMWKSNIDSLTTYFSDGLYDIIKGKYDDWRDAFDDLCDAMLKSFTKMIGEMLTQWTVSGIASLFTGGSVSFSLTGGAGGGTGSNLLSTASTGVTAASLGSKIAGWLGFGGSSATTLGAEAAAAAADVQAVQFATLIEQGMSVDGAMKVMGWSGSSGGSGIMSSISGWLGGSESAATTASSWASLGAGATALVNPFTLAVGAPLALAGVASLLASVTDSSHTPESAREYMTGDVAYLGRLAGSSDVQTYGMNEDQHRSALEAIDELTKIADRAGYSKDLVEQAIQGTAELQQQYAEAVAAGDDELAASLRNQIAQVQELQAALGMTTDGLGEFGAELLKEQTNIEKVDQAISGVKNGVLSYDNSLDNAVRAARDLAGGQQQLAQYLMDVGQEFGLTWDQAMAYADAVQHGEMGTEELTRALEDLASAAASAKGLSEELSGQISGLATQFGLGAADAAGYVAAVNDLAMQYQTGALTSDGLLAKLIELSSNFGLTGDSVKGLAEAVMALIEQLQSIPTDVQASVTVTTYNQSVDLGGSSSGGGGLSDLVSYGGGGSYHTGGLVTAHSGGWLQGLLGRQMITAHGGMYLGGLTSDEVIVKALKKEFILSPDATDDYGVGFLDRLNRRQVPVVNEDDLLGSILAGRASYGGGGGQAGGSRHRVEMHHIIELRGATKADRKLAGQLADKLEPQMRAAVEATLADMATVNQTVEVRHNRGLRT